MTRLGVLIVDDEPDMRLYLRSCLAGRGSRIEGVFEAADGLEALPLARSGAVHLVIADVVLPRLDGRELCRAIRRDPALRHLRVLLIGGEDRRPGPEVGADGYLAQPFNARQLRDALDEVLLRAPYAPSEDVR